MRTDWIDHAVCGGHDPTPWTSKPDMGRERRDRLHQRLGQLCDQCPVRTDCALDALMFQAQEQFRAGVWIPELKDRSNRKHSHAMEELAHRNGIEMRRTA